MGIGKRLRELRLAKHLTQGDIEKRTGLFRCYVSRVEGGHTIPALETLEKFASALDLELYQLFYSGSRKATAPKVPRQGRLAGQERNLVDLFKWLSPPDKKLLLQLARFAAGRQRVKG
jgi:transcriptional regulator with XRE-family HTH domain